ncbi:hypothetical protein [Bacillus smithii]|uniref:hypothetical protein n=1 Tax=Bacillus smithii TaxID=1479 RepID=UPI0030C9504A
MNVAIFTVGSNPLPIYVVAKYLLDNNRQDKDKIPIPDLLIFIYSENSKGYFKTLYSKLKMSERSYKLDKINLGDKERDREEVQNEVKFNLEKLLSRKEHVNSVHLHYTGGTKPMSVFSYAAVEEFGKEHGIKTIYSDLDPEKSLIRVGKETYPIEKDLRDCIKLDINEIFDLHNMNISNNGTESYTYQKVDITKFSLKTINSLKMKKQPSWKAQINSMKSEIKRKLPLNKFQKGFDEVQKEFGHLMPVQWNEVVSSFPLFKKFIEFFDGKWLEDYILDTLLCMKEKLKLGEIKKSVIATYKNRPCEIDVIAMRGYQIHYFTCTTSKNIKIVKGKAFEALYRAEQLGGSHARVIVVSLLPSIKDPKQSDHCIENLEKDLASFEAQIEKRVKLIGRNVLEDPALLAKEIEDIFLS